MSQNNEAICELLRRVKIIGEKMSITNHGLPAVGGDILELVMWAEEQLRKQADAIHHNQHQPAP